MRRFDYPVAPLILAMVLGKMMDSNFRQAVSLASSSDNPFMAMFGQSDHDRSFDLYIIRPSWKYSVDEAVYR